LLSSFDALEDVGDGIDDGTDGAGKPSVSTANNGRSKGITPIYVV
jgi:hypothetical protein